MDFVFELPEDNPIPLELRTAPTSALALSQRHWVPSAEAIFSVQCTSDQETVNATDGIRKTVEAVSSLRREAPGRGILE